MVLSYIKEFNKIIQFQSENIQKVNTFMKRGGQAAERDGNFRNYRLKKTNIWEKSYDLLNNQMIYMA